MELLSGEIEPGVIVILSDINMPGMDGLRLLGEIKRRFPDLPVMMVTAYGDDERRRRASELGAFQFISKPVDFDFLKKQLRQLPTGRHDSPEASSKPPRLPWCVCFRSMLRDIAWQGKTVPTANLEGTRSGPADGPG